MKTTTSSKTSSVRARSARRSGQPAPVRNAAVQPLPGSSIPDKHILLVDDDPKVRDSLNDVLVSEGYVVIPAENGTTAEVPISMAKRFGFTTCLSVPVFFKRSCRHRGKRPFPP